MFESNLPLASVVFAALWLISSAVVAVIYPAVSAILPAAPKQRAAALLFLCTGPLCISLAITVLEFSTARFVSPHCHIACRPHVPKVFDDAIEWGFLMGAVLLVGSVAFFLYRRGVQAQRLGRILDTIAPHTRETFWVVESREALAVSVGLFKPRVFISRGLIQNVSREELKAIVEHEQEHGRRRDNLQKLLAFLCTIPSLVQRRLLADLSLAVEQCCDAVAARVLGDPLLVAETLVAVQKLSRGARGARCGFDSSNIEARVNALLQPSIEPAYPVLVPGLLAGALCVIVLALDPLHHQIENMLEWLHLLV